VARRSSGLSVAILAVDVSTPRSESTRIRASLALPVVPAGVDSRKRFDFDEQDVSLYETERDLGALSVCDIRAYFLCMSDRSSFPFPSLSVLSSS
jgi:hypothetical protein